MKDRDHTENPPSVVKPNHPMVDERIERQPPGAINSRNLAGGYVRPTKYEGSR